MPRRGGERLGAHTHARLTLTLTLTLTRHAPDKSTGHAFVIFNEEVATLVSALALALALDLPQAPTPTLT